MTDGIARQGDGGEAPGELVEVVCTASVADARVLAAALRRGGIAAVPHVRRGDQQADSRAPTGADVVCVLVPAHQLDVAEQALDLSTHAPLGPASREEIEAELAAMADAARHDGAAPGASTAALCSRQGGRQSSRALLWAAGVLLFLDAIHSCSG